MKRFGKLLLGIALFGLVGAVLPAAPASAADGDGVCESGEVCVYSGDNFTGCYYEFGPTGADSDYTNGSPVWNNSSTCGLTSLNDQISSYKNRTGDYVTFYVGTNYTDNCFVASAGASSGDLSGNFWTWDGGSPANKFSSHHTGWPTYSTCVDWQDQD